MLTLNDPCFVAVAQKPEQRVLIAGSVRLLRPLPPGAPSIASPAAVVALDLPVNVKPGGELTVFAEVRGKLHQQRATVVSVTAGGDHHAAQTLEIQPQTVPELCDYRAAHRVSVATLNLSVRVGQQANCKLLDISADGLGVVAPNPLPVGQQVEIDLSAQGIYARGSLKVQTETKLADGGYRYGLHAPEKKSPIRRSLDALANLFQRRQVQRMARAA